MNKLLHRTLLYYAAAALLMMVVSAPVYYWLSQKLYHDDVDEAIFLRRDEFYAGPLKAISEVDILTWNRFNRDTRILSDTVRQPNEAIVEQVFYDSLADEWEPYRVLYSSVHIGNNDYTLMIRLNLVESEDLLSTTILLYCVAMLALLVGFVLISRVVSARIWKPFYQTLDRMEQFNIESQSPPQFDETRIKEFRQLHHALDRMIAQNLRAYKTQKEFTENASHELQTPLAVFRSKLDMLLQDPALNDRQAGTLQQLYTSVARLSRLNKNLLVLARLDNNSMAQYTGADVDKVVREVLSNLKELAEQKQLSVHIDFKDKIVVNADHGMLELLFSNLLLNAIIHNHRDGSISIVLVNGVLTIANSGDQHSLDREKIFLRFSKTSAHTQGSGLGLAIVKKVADTHGWHLEYSFENPSHVFRVRF